MVESIEQRRKMMEAQLLNLQRQVDTMDAKIRAYLADRENKPHPRHQELVEKIQLFRIDPSISNKHLETMLDNLQWKVYYHNRAWQQLWQNDTARREQARRKAASEAGGPKPSETSERRSIYSVDRLWVIQAEKLQQLGETAANETREEFVKRIKQRYGHLASEKSDSEEIVMVFDKQEKRCTLELKKKK